jgi:DNA-binding response OmpR family regulator
MSLIEIPRSIHFGKDFVAKNRIFLILTRHISKLMIKVVLVDDDVDLLDMVCLMLKTPGIQSVCFDDCKQVLPVLENEMPDVLVMDVFLGECDGRDLCKQVKSMEQFATLPVLLYSAAQIPSGSIRESGADFFLQKPFEMDVLLGKIHQLANADRN